jgi:hypothetical protein
MGLKLSVVIWSHISDMRYLTPDVVLLSFGLVAIICN